MIRSLLLLLALHCGAPAFGQRLQGDAAVKWITSSEGLKFKMDREDFICCDSCVFSTHDALVNVHV